MNKLLKLNEITEIHAGYSFRGAVVDEESGTYVIQARDIEGLNIDLERFPRVEQAFPPERILKKGDILLTSRGSFRAGVFTADCSAVASSSLFSLRLSSKAFLPEFVAIYLNSAQAQNYFIQCAKGATIQSLTTWDLAGLVVPRIPIERQELLIRLYQNVVKQGELLKLRMNRINEIYTETVNKNLRGVA